MELGLGWLRAVAQGYSYSCSKMNCKNKSNEFEGLGSKMGLGLGWLRAVAQGYSYSYHKVVLDE